MLAIIGSELESFVRIYSCCTWLDLSANKIELFDWRSVSTFSLLEVFHSFGARSYKDLLLLPCWIGQLHLQLVCCLTLQ
jgi:hypothetical protein